MLEIEKRGQLSNSDKDHLKSFLLSKGKLIRRENQLNIFIEFNSPYLGSIENSKASINISLSKNLINNATSGNLKVKTGKMESSNRLESNLPFNIDNIMDVFNFLKVFQITEGCPRFYCREDYKYDDLVVSIKEKGLAPDHFEVEMQVDSPDKSEFAIGKINTFGKLLGLKFYTDSEYKDIMLKTFYDNPPVPFGAIDLGLIT